MAPADIIYLLFVFALGACVGSFLNVVVWRVPRGESLVTPPSRCPACGHKLAWRDNIPIFGWVFLRGRCRYCRAPISARYPIVEFVTALLFAFYYVAFFVFQIGPSCDARMRDLSIDQDWAMYGLYMFMLAALLAASLIDAELFIIPLRIPWSMALIGVIVHTIMDVPSRPGALNAMPAAAALSAGASIGLAISIGAWYLGWLPTSFPQGEPILEVDRDAVAREIEEAKSKGENLPPLPPSYTRKQIRREMRKEMAFLLPPLILGFGCVALTLYAPPVHHWWDATIAQHDWLSGLLGSLLGALVGGFVVWLTRILGTLGFGRVAMGLGDVHLMFGVGAIGGAGPATVAFFLAPFFGILIAIYRLISGTRRELPYGPYLSLATAFVILFYCPIAAYLSPGMTTLASWIHSLLVPGAPPVEL